MPKDESPLRLLDGPPLDDADKRVARQRELGLSNVPDARFDALARKIVERTGALAAMVNLVGDQRMYFTGVAVREGLGPGDPVAGQAALAYSQHVAFAAQFQIFLRDAKAVRRLADHL